LDWVDAVPSNLGVGPVSQNTYRYYTWRIFIKTHLFFILLIGLNVFSAIDVPPYMYLDTDNTQTALFIHWKGGEGTMYYGIINSGFNQTATGTNYVHLTGLNPGGRYQWYLDVDGDKSDTGSFHLDPGPGQPFTMVIFGDTQYMGPAAERFFKYVYEINPDLFIIVGDLTRDKDSECDGEERCQNLDSLFRIFPKAFANSILVPIRGNHDSKGQHWVDFFPHIPATLYNDTATYGWNNQVITSGMQIARNYFLDYGNISFSINDGGQTLDNGAWNGSVLREWWEEKIDLRMNHGQIRPMIIALSHYNREENYRYGPVYQSRKGVLWYNGHTHFYARTKWVKIKDSEDGAESVSDTQQPEHMIFCHAGSPVWPLACDSGSNSQAPNPSLLAYRNCAEDTNTVSILSIVDVSDEGMIHHRARSVPVVGDHELMDSFTVDGTAMVDDYSAATSVFFGFEREHNDVVMGVWPNPFNPAVKITVNRRAAASENPTLCIYNASGKMVQRLRVSSYQLQSGIVWDASAFPSGIYMARVYIGGMTLIKTMILLK